jgi:hypothetical protein
VEFSDVVFELLKVSITMLFLHTWVQIKWSFFYCRHNAYHRVTLKSTYQKGEIFHQKHVGGNLKKSFKM